MPKTEQPPLLIEEPPSYTEADVEVAKVVDEPWGAPPDDQLKRNVAMAGLLMPVIFQRADDGRLRIIEGRRRFQAARDAGFETVPGRILEGDIGAGVHALTLSGNAHTSHNRVMDLFAIEEIMVAEGIDEPVELARRARIPLSDVKRILQLQNLRGEIRDAWREGKLSNAVGIAAAKLEADQQDKLVAVLAANGTLTMKDVQEAKKSAVRSHQRTLPSQNWRARTREALRKAQDEVWEALGECELSELIVKALGALEELEDGGGS